MIGYSLDDTTGFPHDYKFSNIKGSIIVPTSLESNVVELHKFLYGDEAYTPSEQVVANSQKILEIVGGEGQLEDTQTVNPDDENTANDTILWQENDDGGWNDVSGNYTDPDPGYQDPDPGYQEPDPDPGYQEPDPDPGYQEPDPDPGYQEPDPDPGYQEPDPDPGYQEPDPDPGYQEPVEGGGEEGASEPSAEASEAA